tara:strand:+ start:366 stop:518 length:153 start_codon:yes stop_codon:yes gene_type:complete
MFFHYFLRGADYFVRDLATYDKLVAAIATLMKRFAMGPPMFPIVGNLSFF